MTFPASASESVTINGQTRGRSKSDGEPWGPWTCFKARSSDASIQATVEVSRGPDMEIEGTPVRTYVYTRVDTITLSDKTQSTLTQKMTLHVGEQTGLPRREVSVQVLQPDDRELTLTMDYYDYDAKIEITLPPCEKEAQGMWSGARLPTHPIVLPTVDEETRTIIGIHINR